jgi:trehalose/maltose hydrolase-like predicted phosphorylase
MSASIPDDWLKVARQLKIPYDKNLQYHPEFDGYKLGEPIKQADVVLLGFPIMYVKDYTARKNDLEFYENVTRIDGPAMTWSMHAIGHLEIDEESRAETLLNRSYQPYVVEPFKVRSCQTLSFIILSF